MRRIYLPIRRNCHLNVWKPKWQIPYLIMAGLASARLCTMKWLLHSDSNAIWTYSHNYPIALQFNQYQYTLYVYTNRTGRVNAIDSNKFARTCGGACCAAWMRFRVDASRNVSEQWRFVQWLRVFFSWLSPYNSTSIDRPTIFFDWNSGRR